MRKLIYRLVKSSVLMGAIFLGFFVKEVKASEVVINEVLANPVDEADEFVELYNKSEADINLSGYSLEDLSKTYIIPEATISAKGFFSLKKIETKIALNNSGQETVTLKDGNNNTIDSFSYEGTKEGKSCSRIPDGSGDWVQETEITEGKENSAPASPEPTSSPNISPSPESNSDQSSTADLAPSPSVMVSSVPSPSVFVSPDSDIEIKMVSRSGQVLGEEQASESASAGNGFGVPVVLAVLGSLFIGGSCLELYRQYRDEYN